MSAKLTSTRDSGSSSASLSTDAGLPKMRESVSLMSFSASSALRTMYASATDTLTLEFRLNESFVAPRMRHMKSLSTLTEASLSYWMRVSERKTVALLTTISSCRKWYVVFFQITMYTARNARDTAPSAARYTSGLRRSLTDSVTSRTNAMVTADLTVLEATSDQWLRSTGPSVIPSPSASPRSCR